MTAPTARFVLTDDVLVEGGMRTLAEAVSATRTRYVLYAAVMAALFAVLLVTGSEPDGALPWLSGWMAVAFVGLAAATPWLMRRRLRRLAVGRSDLGQTMTVRALPDALDIEVPRVSQTRLWLSALHGVEPSPAGVLVLTQPRDGLWIPAAAFATADHRDAFERVLLAGAPLPDPAL